MTNEERIKELQAEQMSLIRRVMDMTERLNMIDQAIKNDRQRLHVIDFELDKLGEQKPLPESKPNQEGRKTSPGYRHTGALQN